MIRVLVVDDEPLVRSGLVAVLSTDPGLLVVGEASDGAEVPARVRHDRPDVVLMDVRMPRVDGLQATRSLVAGAAVGGPDPRVLVLTTFASDGAVWDALAAGAAGFLLKRATAEELLDAVRVVAAGESLLFPAAVRALARTSVAAPDPGVGRRLTGREAQVLRLLADGLTNAEIAARLVVGVETVKTHVANVLAKLGARDRTQAVVFAYRSGFVSPL